MKVLTILLVLLLLSIKNIFGFPGEIWFLFDDNNNHNYYVVATRISSTDPLFGENFMEVDSELYNIVTSNSDAFPGVEIPTPFDVRRGFDYIRDPSGWPLIGEGKLEFSIYLDNNLVFRFKIDLVNSRSSPDLTFEYTASTGIMFANGSGANPPVTQILYDEFYNCWELLDEERNISRYVNQVTLTNLVGGEVENDIKTTFDNAVMGFPYEDVQLGVQYDPGTIVQLWRGVYYDLSVSHSSYTNNNIVYNFRNWRNYSEYTTSSTLRVLEETDEFRSMFYPTIPLTIANNLEGGSSNSDYEVTWHNPDPDIIIPWQFGIDFNAFNYQDNSDFYSAGAPTSMQSIGTNWYFRHWDDGLTNNIKSNIQVTAPTTITAYYKGNLRSDDITAYDNNNQRKFVKTGNGHLHSVYTSMGALWYERSTDGGSTWEIMNNGSPLNEDNPKGASLDYLPPGTGDDIIRKIWNRMGIIPGENILNDINFVLMSPLYEVNLNEAVRYYAEWRYFTGSRDDNLHFNNAEDLPTSFVYAQHSGNVGITSVPNFMGFGGTRFIEFTGGQELVEVGFNGEDTYPWIASIIEKRNLGSPANHIMALNGNWEGSIELVSIDAEKLILAPILNTYVSKVDCDYYAQWYDGREVLFYNKISGNNVGGNLLLNYV